MNDLKESTRLFVQWLEDFGHGAAATPHLCATVEYEIKKFIVMALNHYRLPIEDVGASTTATEDGVLTTKVKMHPDVVNFIKDQEPDLYAVLMSGNSGMCACQVIEGVIHTHD